MKFTLTFKTPDVLEQVLPSEPSCSATDEEWDLHYEKKREIEKLSQRFLRFGEYITVSFDSETMTAEVV